MTTKETLALILEKLDNFDNRIATLESNKSASRPSSKKNQTVTAATKKSLKTTAYSVKLADYEPKKVNGNYVWGKKSDTIKSGHYMAMRKAYCYAVATNGKALTSDECFKQGITVDFSEKSLYYKAKADFEKKFKYVKKADR